MKRIVILALAIAALSFVMAGPADAVCSQLGEIVRVQTTPGAGGTVVFLRNTSLSNFVWNATTADLKTAEMAAAALGKRVQIVGGAPACPAIVVGGNLAMGVISSIILHP